MDPLALCGARPLPVFMFVYYTCSEVLAAGGSSQLQVTPWRAVIRLSDRRGFNSMPSRFTALVFSVSRTARCSAALRNPVSPNTCITLSAAFCCGIHGKCLFHHQDACQLFRGPQAGAPVHIC